MKVKIIVEIADHRIVESYREPNEIFALRHFPKDVIRQAQEHCMRQMGEAIDRAIMELLNKGVVQEPTSYPPEGNPHEVKGSAT